PISPFTPLFAISIVKSITYLIFLLTFYRIHLELFISIIRRPTVYTLFPYTTLFRSLPDGATRHEEAVTVVTTLEQPQVAVLERRDRKSTRLNSSHVSNSYAVFCLKKKK